MEQGQTIHPSVKRALDRISNDFGSTVRTEALLNLEQDKNIYEALVAALPDKNAFSQIKDSLMMQLIRLVSEDAHQLPKTMAKGLPDEPDIRKYAAEKIVDTVHVDEDYRVFMNGLVRAATFKEGTSFAEILPERVMDYRDNKETSRIKHTRIDSANTFCDPLAIDFIHNSNWAATRHEYDLEAGQAIARDMYGFNGEIKQGDPMYVYREDQSTGNDEDMPFSDKVVFYKYYDKFKREFIVFGGGQIQTLRILKGEDYPFYDKRGQAEFPIAQFDATPYKPKGIRCLSYLGVARDITRQKTEQFNAILPYFKRVNNQILAVSGATPAEDISDQLATAEEMQEQGMSGLLTLQDPQSRIFPVYPQDATAAFDRISVIFDNELAKRLGLDLAINEKSEQSGFPTATQIVQRTKTQAKAIANINRVNIVFYTRVNNLVLNLVRDAFSNSNEVFTISTGKNLFKMKLKELVTLVKDWRGTWSVDTTVDVELTRSEKATILREFKQHFTSDAQLPFTSEDLVRPFKDAVWAEISLLGLDDIFQQSEIERFYSAVVERNRQVEEAAQQQALAEQQARQGQASGGPAPIAPPEASAEGILSATQDQAAEQGAEAPQPSI